MVIDKWRVRLKRVCGNESPMDTLPLISNKIFSITVRLLFIKLIQTLHCTQLTKVLFFIGNQNPNRSCQLVKFRRKAIPFLLKN